MIKKRCKPHAFTLIELMIVLIILGILSMVAIPKIGGMIQSSRIAATEKEMKTIAAAILGDAERGILGYEANMQDLPDALSDLYTDPGGGYNAFTEVGWNGPYVDSNDLDGSGTADVLEDAWGNAYVYSKAGARITSYGSDGAAGGTGTAADIVVYLE